MWKSGEVDRSLPGEFSGNVRKSLQQGGTPPGSVHSPSRAPRDTDRFAQGERSLVKRAAHDDTPRGDRHHRAKVIDVTDAAAGEDGDIAGLGQAARVLDIRTLQHAVLRHVGVEDRADGPAGDLLRDVDRAAPGIFGPAARRDDAVLRIERENELVGERRIVARERFEPRPILDRLRPDDDARCAGLEQPLHVRGGADPATRLHLHAARFDDVGDQLALRGPAFLGAVEVDDVQPSRAGVSVRAGDVERVDVVVDLPAVVALLEPDDAPAAQIDAGNDLQRHGGEPYGCAGGDAIRRTKIARSTPRTPRTQRRGEHQEGTLYWINSSWRALRSWRSL